MEQSQRHTQRVNGWEKNIFLEKRFSNFPSSLGLYRVDNSFSMGRISNSMARLVSGHR